MGLSDQPDPRQEDKGQMAHDETRLHVRCCFFTMKTAKAVQQLSKGAVQSQLVQDFKTRLGKAQDGLD